MDCGVDFYQTIYAKSYYPRPASCFPSKAEHIPEVDPNLIPGHSSKNIKINGYPLESKTWEKPNVAEEYRDYLPKLKTTKPELFEKYFTNPQVNFDVLESSVKDGKLTSYQSKHSPYEYVSSKDCLKCARSKLDTSRFSYQPTAYKTYYNRIEEINEMRALSKPFTWKHDVEQLKNELRMINKTTQTTYVRHFCPPSVGKMLGKCWEPPLDAHTLRRV